MCTHIFMIFSNMLHVLMFTSMQSHNVPEINTQPTFTCCLWVMRSLHTACTWAGKGEILGQWDTWAVDFPLQGEHNFETWLWFAGLFCFFCLFVFSFLFQTWKIKLWNFRVKRVKKQSMHYLLLTFLHFLPNFFKWH